MQSEGPVRIEALLSHREWVRSVARCLVRGEAAADDLEQQAWLEAAERPPSHAGSIRGWFRTVLRRRARDRWREGERRDRRERAAARPEPVPSAATVVAEAEAHRRVVEAVMALEEPYRSTLLLRFYEDLPPREVAARTGVPVETVRTRTRRALERMRERLDGNRGGRGAWMAAFAPLVGVRAEPVGGVAGIAGGAAMASKTTIAAVGAAAALAALVGGSMLLGGGPAPEAPAKESAAARPPRPVPPPLPEPAPAPAAAPAPAPAPAPAVDPATTARLAEQDRRIATLEARLAVDARVAEALKEVPPPPAVDLKTVSTEELLSQVRNLMRPRGIGEKFDAAGLLERCGILLGRTIDPDVRAEILIAKGVGHRVQKDAVAEEAAFKEALALHGPNTPRGREARIQLAWTASATDPRAAADAFLVLAAEPDAPPNQRAWNRYNAAVQLERAGDPERAGTEYRAVVDEFGTSTDGAAKMAADGARRALDRRKD